MSEQNHLSDSPKGFSMPERISIEKSKSDSDAIQSTSNFASSNALEHIQLIRLTDGEGSLLYYPQKGQSNMGTGLEVGDVIFLREKLVEQDKKSDIVNTRPTSESGLVVQIISLGTANYPQSQTKALFRVMVNVRATTLNRSHNEPPETIDELLEAEFKVRASITDGVWGPPEGRVVTRNVDIFLLDPSILAKHIFSQLNFSRFSISEFEEIKLRFSSIEDLLKGRIYRKKIAESSEEFVFIDCQNLEASFIKDNIDLVANIFKNSIDINLGDYKGEPVAFFGAGLEKINLITGMKGGGKSHIAKGIIAESLRASMSAVVFDINNEYGGLPNSNLYIPGQNLRFRLDRINPSTFLGLINRISPFAERTGIIARNRIPGIIRDRSNEAGHIPDIPFLLTQADNIFPGRGEVVENMRASYRTSLEIIQTTNMIMTEREALSENGFIDGSVNNQPDIVSLSSALFNLTNHNPGVIIFNIGGLLKDTQYSVVDMVLDTLKDICSRQTKQFKENKAKVPNYPTIYFEEAHMYMEPHVIDDLLPLIRHFGMNVFFITNTPGALPESVFRLMDNLLMTRLINQKDIDQLKKSGLADAETIEGFAANLRQYHALLLSAQSGTTKNFPLVFRVRDFGLPTSGETKSMWGSLKEFIGENKE